MTPSGCPVTPGCPIRRSPDQCLFDNSPKLIAVYNVLHRLCTPRHPPYTLRSLTTFMNRCVQATAKKKLLREHEFDPRTISASDPVVQDTVTIPTHPLCTCQRSPSRRATTPFGWAELLNRDREPYRRRTGPSRPRKRSCKNLEKWSRPGSNRQPPQCKCGALPIELQPLNHRPNDALSTAVQPARRAWTRMEKSGHAGLASASAAALPAANQRPDRHRHEHSHERNCRQISHL